MKINQLQQSGIVSHYMNGAARIPQTAGTGAVSSADSVELSSSAQEYAALLRSARSQMDQAERDESVRAGEVMAQVQNGTYQAPDDDTLAKTILGGTLPEYC